MLLESDNSIFATDDKYFVRKVSIRQILREADYL